jgi:hypothetical protein
VVAAVNGFSPLHALHREDLLRGLGHARLGERQAHHRGAHELDLAPRGGLVLAADHDLVEPFLDRDRERHGRRLAEHRLVDQFAPELELELVGLGFRRAGREPSENTMSARFELDGSTPVGEFLDGQCVFLL